MSKRDGDLRSWQTVSSADGTAISFVTTGRGAPVIVVSGVLSTTADFTSFAKALGRTHTVHTVERRGRGLSGPQGDDYSMIKECEDIAAVQAATGATLIFGHSYGGLIALEAARSSQVYRKVAVYEPGVSVAGSIGLGWIDDCKAKLAKGKPLEAFAAFSIAAGPRRARRTPLWAMTLLLPLFISAADRRQMFALLPANLREHKVIGQLDDSYPRYGQLQADVLAMCGGKSDLDWVGLAMDALASALPSVMVKAFPKLDHFGPTKTGPRDVAKAAGMFFQDHTITAERTRG